MNDSHKNSENIAKESAFNTRKPELVALRERQRNRNRAVAALGVLVVLATAMALMVPAITMARGDLICGMEEHQHSDACYEKALTCTQEEGEGHVHSDACYESKLTCDKDAHTHDDTCYALELNITQSIPEWGGQDACMMLEETIAFTGGETRFMDDKREIIRFIKA